MIRRLTRADSAGTLTALAIAVAYGAVPLGLYLLGVENPYMLSLAEIAGFGAAFIWLGAKLPLLDGVPRYVPRMAVSTDAFVALVALAFAAFVVVASATAERIPLVASLQGADPATIAMLRERFLKAREGWQASFVYINALLAGALVPYALMLMQLTRHRLRWWAFAGFLVYCTSFAEKAFFLKAAVPLLYLVAQGRVASRLRPGVVIGGMAAILVAVTIVSGAGSDADRGGDGDFFSSSFAAGSPTAFMLWRAFAVPIITAADALRVFDEQYGSRFLWGASSSFVAGILGQERVSVERDVFAAQWGQTETGTGSANSVFLTEAYLNFGIPGVVMLSMLVGLILRAFSRTRDEAFRSLWPLFAFGVFVSGLLGTLLSNGFLLVMAIGGLTRFRAKEAWPPSGGASAPRQQTFELPAEPKA